MESLCETLLSHAADVPCDRWVNVEAIAREIGASPEVCRHAVRRLREAGRWPWPSEKETEHAFAGTIRSMLEAGRSRAEIARATGRTVSTVNKAVGRLGLAGTHGATTLDSRAEFAARFRGLAARGAGVTEIATELGIATGTVYSTAARLRVDVRRRAGWEDQPAERDVSADEARYYLECRDAALALDATDPRYPAARAAWIAAERSARPHLDRVGVAVGGRIVGVDCVGDVWVGTRARRVGKGKRQEVRCSS